MYKKRYLYLAALIMLIIVGAIPLSQGTANGDEVDVRRSSIYGISVEGATAAIPSTGGWHGRIWESADSNIVTIGYRWWSVGQYCYDQRRYTFYTTYGGQVKHHAAWHWDGHSYEWVTCTQNFRIESKGRHEFGHCNTDGECTTIFLYTHARTYR